MDDLEEQIPVYKLNKIDDQKELRIVKASNDGVFITTEYEKVKLAIQSVNSINSVVKKNISDVVSLTILDIKSATLEDDLFKVHGFFFRKVLCYGRLVLKNIFTTSTGKIIYLFDIDDGTQEITAKLYKSNDHDKSVATNQQWLTLEKKRLSRMHETGINVNGLYLDPKTKECQKILESVSNFQLMIGKNINKQKHDYQLGPIAEKALVLARPYKTATGDTELHIYDISLNDKIELYWKCSLSKIYNNQYLKKR